MQRMGKGLVWNGVSSTDIPIVFMPLTISATWPAATSTSTSDTAYELIGPQVFRFEYCYLLKSNGSLSITPPTDVSGIAAIIADIAVIDPKSKVLADNSAQVPPPNDNITRLAGRLVDYSSGMVPGQLLTNWRTTIDANSIGLPRPALSGVRLYERFFYLSPPTL
jgi:hypothetical protein